LHRGLERREFRQPLDLAIEIVAPLQLVEQQCVILAEHEPVGRREWRLFGRQMLEPAEMGRAPVRALAIHESAPGEELEDVVPGLENLPLECLSATDDVADPLLGFAEDADRGEFAATVEPGQLGGVVLVVLALDARPFGDERRGDDVTGIAPLVHRAVDHIAGATGLVAGVEFTLLCGPIEPALEFDEIVREPVEAGRRLRVSWEDGDGDGLLVYIHPEIDDSASSRNRGT
jgi:hypothetical protein